MSAYRGVITDRNGEPLAVSTPVESLWVDPQVLVQEPHRWAELAQALGWDQAQLESRLARFSNREFMYLQRHLPPHQAEQVMSLKIPGVYSQRERSEEHTSELQSRGHLVCRLLLEKKKTYIC